MFHFEKTFAPNGFLDGCHQAWVIVPMNVMLKPVVVWYFRFDDEVLVVDVAHLTPVRTHATHQIRAGQHQRAEALFALAQRFLCLLALGDIAENDGDFSAFQAAEPRGIDIKITAQSFQFADKANRFTRLEDFGVDFDALRLMIRGQFTYPLSCRAGNAGLLLKSRIHLQKAVIDR